MGKRRGMGGRDGVAFVGDVRESERSDTGVKERVKEKTTVELGRV